MPASRSSTYNVPLTTVPAGADGVMVTFTVAEAPVAMVMPSKANEPFITPAQKSANGGVTEESIAFVVTVAVRLAVPDGAVPAYGPHSAGWANQPPAVTRPPAGA